MALTNQPRVFRSLSYSTPDGSGVLKDGGQFTIGGDTLHGGHFARGDTLHSYTALDHGKRSDDSSPVFSFVLDTKETSTKEERSSTKGTDFEQTNGRFAQKTC